MDNLISALLKSDRFMIRVDGRLYRPRTAIAAGDLISRHKGRKLRYRRRGFNGYPQGRFAAVIA